MNQKVRVTLLVFAFACLVVPIAEAEGPNDRDGFSVRDIAGPMAFALRRRRDG